MPDTISTATLVSLALTGLMGLASLFGAAWLRRMEGDMAEMRKQMAEQVRETNDKLEKKVGKEDFTEFRTELRDNFRQVFTRMDGLREQISTKADRP